jgi:hypothetical protein
LRIIVEHAVVIVIIWLARWRCRKCQKRFTDYPSFALPYKRYDAYSLLQLAQSYVEHDQQSYRQTVCPHGRLIGYGRSTCSSEAEQDGVPSARISNPNDNRATHHSLVWRFLSWLGVLTVALREARRMIRGVDPNSICHRFDGAVAPQKFRTRRRQQVLQQARQILMVMPEWEACFQEEFFPKFATRSGFD